MQFLPLFVCISCTILCRINQAYLKGTKKFSAPEISEAPLIVFINSRSGGHAGPKLTEVLYQSLGHAQVSYSGTKHSVHLTCWQSVCHSDSAHDLPVLLWAQSSPTMQMSMFLQVYDLQDFRPKTILQQIWANFREREANGDGVASIMRE